MIKPLNLEMLNSNNINKRKTQSKSQMNFNSKTKSDQSDEALLKPPSGAITGW